MAVNLSLGAGLAQAEAVGWQTAAGFCARHALTTMICRRNAAATKKVESARQGRLAKAQSGQNALPACP